MKSQVLVTGPGDGRTLASALAASGLHVVRMPLLQTQQVQLGSEALQRLYASLQRAKAVVVSSPRAAAALADILDEWGRPGESPLPPGVPVLAVGRTTASVLQSRGLPGQAPQTGEGVEALLSGDNAPIRRLSVGARLVIFSGYAARPWLKIQLRLRGLEIDEYKLYRRQPVVFGEAERQKLSAALQDCRLAVVTSAAALRFLLAQAVQSGGAEQLPPILTPSGRLSAIAHSLGLCSTSAGTVEVAALAAAAQGLLGEEAVR